MKMPEQYPMTCPTTKSLCQNGVGFYDPETKSPTSLNNQGFLEMFEEAIPENCATCKKLVREIMDATDTVRNPDAWHEKEKAA